MSKQLKEAREKAGYTIEEVARKLNIRKQYLIDLEDGNYDALPGQVYVQGYRKMYSELLGITLELYEPDLLSKEVEDKKPQKTPLKYKKYFLLLCFIILVILNIVYTSGVNVI